MRNGWLFCAVCSVLCFFGVEAIKCFQCTSVEDPDCSSLKSTDTNSSYLLNCGDIAEGHKPFCRKTIHTILDQNKLVRITRSCGWILWKKNTTNCYNNDSDFKFEKSCQCFTDGCNAAPALISGKALFGALALNLAFKFLY